MRNRFPFFKLNPNITYLDSAATSQTLDSVVEDSTNFLLNHKANAHRSGHSMGAWVDEHYHSAKNKIGEWLNIPNPAERIVFNSGASQGLYDAVQLVKQRYTGHISVYVGIDSHHSLLLPLRDASNDIKYINVRNNGMLDLDAVEEAIKEDSATCKVIAINAVGNVLGTKQDLDRVRSLCKKYDAISIIDACQSMGKIEHNYDGFDFVAWSWHKIYGPTGLGCLMLDEKWLWYNPVHPGGGSVLHVSLSEVSYLETANRFESGTQNLQAICTLPNLLDWLIENYKNIIAHDEMLTEYANKLCKNKVVPSHTGLISFATDSGTVEDVVMMLDAYNICVRGGNLCAEPLVAGITNKNNLIRVSWSAYTTKEELEFVFEKIGEVSARISKFV
jgi:cysteine desulfurase/selenocysteine lyase